MDIYSAVKSKTDKMNISIAQLEKRAAVANGTIGKWRKGKPYAETLRKVTDVLGCTVNELLDEAAGKGRA